MASLIHEDPVWPTEGPGTNTFYDRRVSKHRMRYSDRACYGWVRCRAQQETIRLTTTTEGATANTTARRNAITTVWKRIYRKHASGEPAMANCFREFGARMKRNLITLPEVETSELRQVLLSLQPSSGGLDGFVPIDLRTIAQWCPRLVDRLAQLMRVVELTGTWPTVATAGTVAPSCYRPITVLCAIYISFIELGLQCDTGA